MTGAGHYLYRIRPTRPEMLPEGPTPEESAIIGDHAAYIEKLAKEGVVRLAGRTLTTGPESFGIVIVDAGSEESARRVMEKDPAVKQGVMRAELFPFRIAYEGE
jgi:uncharacterized protein YciI